MRSKKRSPFKKPTGAANQPLPAALGFALLAPQQMLLMEQCGNIPSKRREGDRRTWKTRKKTSR